VRLLAIGLRRHEHVHAELEPRRGVDDLVAALAGGETAARRRRDGGEVDAARHDSLLSSAAAAHVAVSILHALRPRRLRISR
jgi:hypothetical protein